MLPKSEHPATSRGTIVHSVFEVLLGKNRKELFDKILKNGSVYCDEALKRMIVKQAKKLSISDDENLAVMDEMILVGLNNDFFAEGSLKLEAEAEFNLKNEKFQITGFIDKKVTYTDAIKIHDFKSSKKKFSKKEMEFNMQVLMYSLATWRQTGVIPTVSFVFLRYPKDPMQHAEKVDEDTLRGFETYLEQIGESLADYNEEKARMDYAADDKERTWMCGFGKQGALKKDGSPQWACPHKFPYYYYSIMDEKGKPVKSALKKEDLKITDGQVIKRFYYSGCKRWFR